MRLRRNQLTLTLVALVLGLLVVVQIRSQNAGNGLDNLSAQELTVLVANLNTRNDELRTEVASLQREAADLADKQSRGEISLDQLTSDLAQIRAWAGVDAVTGPGIRVTIDGPIAAFAIDDLLNELRNAGAEALALGHVRIVPGSAVAGPIGALSVENTALSSPIEVSAIGNSESLTGSLTRAGGIVAQLTATFPDVQITVIPVDKLDLPASRRSLVPAHGRPRL